MSFSGTDSGSETSIEFLIREKLKEIEEKENVRILHAVESGSLAWGFASPDSDYDVRFIYVCPMEYYLGLQAKKDVLDWELNETLDINGWDLCKVLQHFHKSNAVMYEWTNSPVVYHTTEDWLRVKEAVKDYFSCKATVEELLHQKKQMIESEKGRRIDSLNEYIVENLTFFKKTVDNMADDRNGDWEMLNQVFLEVLNEVSEK